MKFIHLLLSALIDLLGLALANPVPESSGNVTSLFQPVPAFLRQAVNSLTVNMKRDGISGKPNIVGPPTTCGGKCFYLHGS